MQHIQKIIYPPDVTLSFSSTNLPHPKLQKERDAEENQKIETKLNKKIAYQLAPTIHTLEWYNSH